MEGGAGGDTIQDWELLPGSGSDVVNPENSGENLRNYDEIEGDCSGGMIRLDYFSLDNENRYSKTSLVHVSEEGSIESDNPSWIDPGSETPYQRKNSGEFWSDSGSDRSDERKFGDFEGKNEMGFVENGKSQVGTEGAGEILGIGDFDVKIELGLEGKLKGEVGSEGYGESQFRDKHLGRFWSDSGGDELVSRSSEGVEKVTEVGKEDESEVFGESEGGNGSKGANSSVEIQEMKGEVKSVGVEGTGRIAWWKVPFEVLKYCVLKVNPVWSFSVAAAMLGLVMLGRRLYKMKRKSNSLQLKVTLDDKKVSQFMTRAARLNEAFSVVRRVPIIRPALPAGGVNPWPVMSIR